MGPAPTPLYISPDGLYKYKAAAQKAQQTLWTWGVLYLFQPTWHGERENHSAHSSGSLLMRD